MEQQLYTLDEVCRVLSMHPNSVRRLIRDGHLAPGCKVPGQRGVRWFRIDIEKFLDDMRRQPPPEENSEEK